MSLRNRRLNYTLVGGFVLLIALGIFASLVLLTGRAGPTDRYVTVYDNVKGLKYGTQVLFEGYPVGQVERIVPFRDGERMRFRVELSVARDWPIPADSVAQVTASGLLSAMTIDIRAGDSEALLQPGERLTGGEAADVFAAMSSVAAEITSLSEHSLKPFMRRLGNTVDSFGALVEEDVAVTAESLRLLLDDLRRRVPAFTDGATTLVEQLNRRVPELTGRAERVAGHLEHAGEQLGKLLRDRNVDRVGSILANLDATAADLDTLLDGFRETRGELDTLLADLRRVVATSGPDIERSTREIEEVLASLASDVDVITANLSAASRNFNEFSRQIRQNPGVLLGGKPPRDEAIR